MRQIMLDTETTGLKPSSGHRLIEIGCMELVNRRFTGNNFHYYLNPERKVDQGAYNVHGISDEFLKDKPLFSEIVDDFIAYIRDAELIIHNAPFDLGFIEHEFKMHGASVKKVRSICKVIDTLPMARQLHPGQKNNLDALSKRYDINNFNRDLHGALLDAEILGHVYLAMTGGQSSLFDDETEQGAELVLADVVDASGSVGEPLIVVMAGDEELQVHERRMGEFEDE